MNIVISDRMIVICFSFRLLMSLICIQYVKYIYSYNSLNNSLQKHYIIYEVIRSLGYRRDADFITALLRTKKNQIVTISNNLVFLCYWESSA